MSDTIFRFPPLFLLFVALPVLAGRPLTTDDAAVVEDKVCQVEAWVDRGRDATTGWLVPACNFGRGIEWQVGFARTRADGESAHSEAYAQAKRLLREMRDDSPWGVGLVVGVTRRPLNERERGWQHPYVLLPVTYAAGPITLHVQPGWARDRERGRHLAVWGIAGEYASSERFALLAEAFGENADKPFLRAGGRYIAIKDRLELDVTYVTRPGGARGDRYVSLGLAWFTGAFLP